MNAVLPEVRAAIKICEQWRDLYVERCTSSANFFTIIDELEMEYYKNLQKTGKPKGFYCNKTDLLDAYMEGRMYFLFVRENDDMYTGKSIVIDPNDLEAFMTKSPPKSKIRDDSTDKLFCHNRELAHSLYLFPAFLIVSSGDSQTAEYLWVGKRARGLGLATAMIKTLNITHAKNVLSSSLSFWQKIGVEVLNVL